MANQADRNRSGDKGNAASIPPELPPPLSTIPMAIAGPSTEAIFAKRRRIQPDSQANPDRSTWKTPELPPVTVQPAIRPTPVNLGPSVSLDIAVPGHRDPFGPRTKALREPSPASSLAATAQKVHFKLPLRDDTPQHIRDVEATAQGKGSKKRRRPTPPSTGGRVSPSQPTADCRAGETIDRTGEDVEMEDSSSSPVAEFDSTPESIVDRQSPPAQLHKLPAPKWPDLVPYDTPDNGTSDIARAVEIEVVAEKGKGEPVQVLAEGSSGKVKEAREGNTATEGDMTGREDMGLPAWLRRRVGPAVEDYERVRNKLTRPISAGSSSAYHLVAAQQAIRRDTNRNSRLLSQLLGTQQLISSALQELDNCLDQYVEDGVDLEQFQ